MTTVLLGVLTFAIAGFLAGRGLANVMDIGGAGLKRVYVCYGTAMVCALIGLAVMAASVWS
jgi:hypothetical protein